MNRIQKILDSRLFVFLSLAFFWLLLTILGASWLDPDFGWHFKLGEVIANYGFPKTDPFTYSMPSYPYVDYEWLTNLFFYLVHPKLGFLGLSAFYAFLSVIIPFILIPKKQREYWLLPSILLFSGFTDLIGVRPQIGTWILFALLIKIVSNHKIWPRYSLFYPIVMLIWSNVHGSYPLGILVMFIYVAFDSVQKRKLEFKKLLILLLGIFVTLLNPYGWRNWQEVIREMSKAYFFKKYIMEWLPFYVNLHFSFIAMAVFTIVFSLKSKIKFPWFYYVLFSLLLFSAINSLRLIPYFLIFSTPILALSLDRFKKGVDGLESRRRFDKFYLLLVFIGMAIFLIEYMAGFKNKLRYREEVFYPVKAVEFVKTLDYKGNFFSDFNWGGYLIWKYPERKLFVDGRMAGFFWDAPLGESSYAFRDFLDIVCDRLDIAGVISSYDIEVILWPNQKVIKKASYFSPPNLEYCQPKNDVFKRIVDLGWDKVYEDNLAVIYRKPK